MQFTKKGLKINKFFEENRIILIIFSSAFILRLIFLSPWLEDWDSVQFAFALHKFDISINQPHAPGYFFYILMGRTINFLVKNDTLSLTLLSAILGSLSVIPFFLLVKKLLNNKAVAIISSIIFIFIPIGWMMSEVALTNMPGLFFLLVFAYLLFSYGQKNIFVLCFAGGLILGVRFTEIPIIISLLLIFIIKDINFKKIISCLIAFAGGLCLWLIPTIYLTGIKGSINSYKWIAGYVISHDSMLGHRLEKLFNLLTISYSLPLLTLVLFSYFYIFFTKKNMGKNNFRFILVWTFSYLVPLILVYNLEVPRYTLPLLPVFAIIVSYPLLTLKNKSLSFLYKIFLVFTILFLCQQGLSQLKRSRSQIPPTIAATQYVKDNYSPLNTIVLSSYTFRQFQYYAPEFQNFYAEKLTPEKINQKEIVVIDYSGLKENLPQQYKAEIIETKQFTGDKDIYSRIPKVTLYFLKLSDDI